MSFFARLFHLNDAPSTVPAVPPVAPAVLSEEIPVVDSVAFTDAVTRLVDAVTALIAKATAPPAPPDFTAQVAQIDAVTATINAALAPVVVAPPVVAPAAVDPSVEVPAA